PLGRVAGGVSAPAPSPTLSVAGSIAVASKSAALRIAIGTTPLPLRLTGLTGEPGFTSSTTAKCSTVSCSASLSVPPSLSVTDTDTVYGPAAQNAWLSVIGPWKSVAPATGGLPSPQSI